MPAISRILLLLAVLLLAQACSDDGDSPEQQLRRLVDAGVQAAQARSADDLVELVARDYIDQQGNNRQQLGGLLRLYFLRHRNIHLFTRIDSIEIAAANQASVSLHVAMAGTVISGVDALASLRAQLYRFELQMVREGDEWRLRHASWAPASLDSLN